MKILKYSLIFLLGASLMTSCKKDENLPNPDDISGLGGDTWVKGPIDNWITDNLSDPFNISVKYKWDQSELAINKQLVPPMEEKVIPLMSAIKKVWIDTYIAEAGDMFFKKYSPKFFVLVGSAQFNSNGTITLGQAEGGRKIELFVVNEFNVKGMEGYRLSDSNNVKMQLHTIEHEFGHILHQTILYPQEFKKLSAGFYTSNWNNIGDTTAYLNGFVTPYSMSGSDDDWVETIAVMLVEGRAGFEKIVNSIPDGAVSLLGTKAADAKARLRTKESMVVNYYKEVWGIDFYSLQTRTRAAVESFIY